MDNKKAGYIIDILQKNVVPALGCTEPVAVALAAAKAREVLGDMPETIEVWVSGNILKNAMSVGIPGTGQTGLHIAAALGAVGGDSEKGLEVLKEADENDIETAKALVAGKRVVVKKKETQEPLYIEIVCRRKDHCARVVIQREHTGIVLVERDGETLYSKGIPTGENGATDTAPLDLSIREIYDFCMNVEYERIRFILDGAAMNGLLAEEGLRGEHGLRIGRKMTENIEKGLLSHGMMTDAMIHVSAAVDARMSGVELPAMCNSGSGNQGITVMLPVKITSETLHKSDEELARALLLSNLVSIYIKSYLGSLSALCGVVVAATGASCGIVYLMGGNYENITYAIKNMTGNITGMICDGAKLGCAFKASTGVVAAYEAAFLAIDGIAVPGNDGIVEDDIEKTIKNLATIGSKGMHETDKVIMTIMECK